MSHSSSSFDDRRGRRLTPSTLSKVVFNSSLHHRLLTDAAKSGGTIKCAGPNVAQFGYNGRDAIVVNLPDLDGIHIKEENRFSKIGKKTILDLITINDRNLWKRRNENIFKVPYKLNMRTYGLKSTAIRGCGLFQNSENQVRVMC